MSLRLISMYTHSLASFFSSLDTGSIIEAYRFDRAYLSVYLHLLSELEPLQSVILNRETASHRLCLSISISVSGAEQVGSSLHHWISLEMSAGQGSWERGFNLNFERPAEEVAGSGECAQVPFLPFQWISWGPTQVLIPMKMAGLDWLSNSWFCSGRLYVTPVWSPEALPERIVEV